MGRRGVGEGDEGVKGRWDVEAEVRPPTEGVTIRTLSDGDLERIGLEACRVGGTIVEDLDECLASWAFGVGVSGGVDTSLRVVVGVIGSRRRSRGECCNERVDGDGGKPFDDRWWGNEGSLAIGALDELCLDTNWTGPLISVDWVFLVLCRVGVMRTSAVEEEEPGTADCDFGDGRACDDVCKAGVDIDARRKDGVI